MEGEKDYYKILGVDKNASEDDIKKKFRSLSKEWHPDKFATDSEEKKKEAEEKFKEINEAYSILSDKEKRAQYDNADSGWGPFFDFNPFNRQRNTVRVGSDIRINLHVSLEDAYN